MLNNLEFIFSAYNIIKMGNFRKNKRKAGFARKSVDKAQNQLIKGMKKDIDELKQDIETKYGYYVLSDSVKSYSGVSSTSRAVGIIPIRIGENQGLLDNNNRVGDKVTLKNIYLAYRVQLPSLQATYFNPQQTTIRVMMFWDKQPTAVDTAGANQVNPVYWTSLLQLCALGNTTNDQKQLIMMSKKQWDLKKRFSIVYDKTHTLIGNSSTLSGPEGPRSGTGCVEFHKSYQGKTIRYAGAGTNPVNAQLYIAYLSDSSNAIVSPPLQPNLAGIHLQTRVLYDDA